MSVEIRSVRNNGRAALRASAGLALVLAAAEFFPAIAQTDPETTDAQTVIDLSEISGPQATEQQGAAGRSANRESVYVYGRKISSAAAVPDDLPQVVNVISGETLAEQGVVSLEQALRNVAGITTQIGEGGVSSGDQFFIRGLSAKGDIYTDGLQDFGVYTRDSFNYEQVEVLKGPSATSLGRGTAGGGINTTSKTPTAVTGGSINVAAGSAEYGRITGDWNQTLGDNIAVRINAMLHNNEVEGRDFVYSDRWGVAPSIAFGLGGPTTFSLAYLHQQEDKVPDYGIPTTAGPDGIQLPVSEFGVPPENYLGLFTDIDETRVDTVTARLRHQANDWLTFTSDTKAGVYWRYSQFSPVSCGTDCGDALLDGDPATEPTNNIGGPGPYDQETFGVQNVSTAQINAPIGGLQSEMIIGWDASYQTNDRDQFDYATSRGVQNILTPDNTFVPTLARLRNNTRNTVAKDLSVFISERLWLTPEWSISGGVRAQSFEVDQDQTDFDVTSCDGVDGDFATCFSEASSNTTFVSPRIGVIFEPTMSQSYYVSYASSATPPGVTVANSTTLGGRRGDNPDLDPEENSSIEAGARFALFGERAQVQASVFQQKKDNARQVDPISGDIETSGDSIEINGVELGVAGAITDQWSINATYAWLDAELTDTSTPANIGNTPAFTPENAASVWTTYNFDGALAGLEVGLGANYRDDVFLHANNDRIAPEHLVFDALVSYGWDRYRLSLNAYNLTDELYYAQVHSNRVTPGAGRSFIATLGVVF